MTELEYLQSCDVVGAMLWLADFEGYVRAMRALGKFNSEHIMGGEVKRLAWIRSLLEKEHGVSEW